jgi:hypothetical protein
MNGILMSIFFLFSAFSLTTNAFDCAHCMGPKTEGLEFNTVSHLMTSAIAPEIKIISEDNFNGIIENIKAQVPCKNKMERLPNQTYVLPEHSSLSSIRGNLRQQKLSGNVGHVFAGRNEQGDLLIASQTIDSAGNSTGFNIVLSVCGSPSLFSDVTHINELYIPSGITISKVPGHEFGRLSASINLHISAPAINQVSQPVQGLLDMSFSPLK